MRSEGSRRSRPDIASGPLQSTLGNSRLDSRNCTPKWTSTALESDRDGRGLHLKHEGIFDARLQRYLRKLGDIFVVFFNSQMSPYLIRVDTVLSGEIRQKYNIVVCSK